MEKTKKTPDLRFDGFERDWIRKTLKEVLIPYKEPIQTPHNGYERLGIRSHGKGTFHSYVPKGAELETAQMNIVRANHLIVNITFGWELAVAITNDKDEGKLVSHRFPQFSFNEGHNPLFFRYGLINERLRKYLNLASPGSAGRNRVLKIDKMLEFDTIIPNQQEQIAIVELFSNIEQRINYQNITCEKLRNIKKALLTSLFPQGNNRQPKIRLKGFSGDWEEHILSEFAFRIKRKNENLESENIMTISANYGLISQSEFYNKRIASADLSGYYLMRKGEFAYNKSYSSEYPWGAVKRLDKYNEGVVSNLYIIFGIQNISSDFMSSYFMTGLWYNEVAMCAKEGARNHGLLNISADDFLAIRILIPGSLEEQQAIADLLLQYDRLIQLNDQKLEHLKNLKKALLDKMFV